MPCKEVKQYKRCIPSWQGPCRGHITLTCAWLAGLIWRSSCFTCSAVRLRRSTAQQSAFHYNESFYWCPTSAPVGAGRPGRQSAYDHLLTIAASVGQQTQFLDLILDTRHRRICVYAIVVPLRNQATAGFSNLSNRPNELSTHLPYTFRSTYMTGLRQPSLDIFKQLLLVLLVCVYLLLYLLCPLHPACNAHICAGLQLHHGLLLLLCRFPVSPSEGDTQTGLTLQCYNRHAFENITREPPHTIHTAIAIGF